MTTDITELAQREKFEAWLSEKPLHARYVHWCGALKAYDYTSIQLAWEAYQAGSAGLAEALEKAQQENTDGVAGMAESYETTISMLRSRIAELESRTASAEKAEESAYRAGLTAGWNLGLANNNDGFNKCLAAHSTAGIKWEAE